MFQRQSLCLALLVSLASASAAFPQASAGGLEVQSGDVWVLPGDRASSIVVVPQVSSSKDGLRTGDVWVSLDDQTIPSVAAEDFHPRDVVTRNQ